MGWELSTFVEVFGYGISAGFILFVVFSLLGYGIYKSLKMLNH
jgi:hypothetical protein